MALGKRVLMARVHRELTQEQLCAKVAGLSQAALSALETRDSQKSIFLFGLAKALNVPPEWLLNGVEPSGLIEFSRKTAEPHPKTLKARKPTSTK